MWRSSRMPVAASWTCACIAATLAWSVWTSLLQLRGIMREDVDDDVGARLLTLLAAARGDAWRSTARTRFMRRL